MCHYFDSVTFNSGVVAAGGGGGGGGGVSYGLSRPADNPFSHIRSTHMPGDTANMAKGDTLHHCRFGTVRFL